MERNWALQNPQASSTTKVTCEMPKRGYGNEWYVLSMYVDSLKVNLGGWHRTLYFKDYATPKIQEINQNRYMKINSVVEFRGELRFYYKV